jgi:hypothetical protein
MIEQNAAHSVEVIGLPVIDGDPMPINLCHSVWRTGIERRAFSLGRLGDTPEHFGGAGLVKPGTGMHQPDGLENPGDPKRREFAGEHRLSPGSGHVRLGGEIVDLVGPSVLQHHGQ